MLVAIYIKQTLKVGVLVLGGFCLFSLLWLFSKRLVYPYELDWVEGGMLTSVIQILDGHNLYTQPSITYVPFIYAPVFFYLSAIVAKILGPSLLVLRLVSIVASLASLTMIVLIVRGETKSWFWGLASASLFAGLYPASRFWFDLGRVDSVFVMFFLFFLYTIRRKDSLSWQIAAGVFAALATLTKQAGLTMCLPIIAVYFFINWRHRWSLPLTFLLVYGCVSLAFILSSDGWYTYYCYDLLLSQHNNWMPYTFLDLTKDFILPNIPIVASLTLFLFLFWIFRGSKEQLWIWLIIFVSTLVTTYLGKAKAGGVNNVVIPTFAIFSLFFGICASEVSKILIALPRHRIFAEICVCLLVLFQLAQVVYDPVLYTPSLDDYRDGARALKLVKKFHGNVYVPNSSISLMAGKRTFAHPYAMWEIIHSYGESRGKDILESDLRNAINNRLFDAMIILRLHNYFPNLQKYYVLDDAKYFLLDDNVNERADFYILR